MDREKEEKAKKRLEELKKKAQQEEKNSEHKEEDKGEVPREAFRKNLGCGG
ncbi:MAG: hypothetical protein RIC30_15635 [Marinoscillum sp.]|uniref:hypothetical protein n=1 Tax=Marinoscillum sp. TaxID=2024838 RepID=UPI0032FC73E9